jgi:hypothetical protein
MQAESHGRAVLCDVDEFSWQVRAAAVAATHHA